MRDEMECPTYTLLEVAVFVDIGLKPGLDFLVGGAMEDWMAVCHGLRILIGYEFYNSTAYV